MISFCFLNTLSGISWSALVAWMDWLVGVGLGHAFCTGIVIRGCAAADREIMNSIVFHYSTSLAIVEIEVKNE